MTNVNNNLNFLLAAYRDPTAVPGVVPTPQVAAESLTAMYRRAKSEAYRAGSSDPSHDAEEGLSTALHEIGKSRLTETYRPSPAGVAPWANMAIRRNVRKFIAEKLRYSPVPLMEESGSNEPDPAQLAELANLTQQCDELLGGHPFGVHVQRPAGERPTSTRYVHKHRQRKAAWNIVSKHFPNVRLRPRNRRK